MIPELVLPPNLYDIVTEIKKISKCCDVQALMNSLQIPKSIQHDILLSSKYHQQKVYEQKQQILTIRYSEDQNDEKEEIVYAPAVEYNKKRKINSHMLHV